MKFRNICTKLIILTGSPVFLQLEMWIYSYIAFTVLHKIFLLKIVAILCRIREFSACC